MGIHPTAGRMATAHLGIAPGPKAAVWAGPRDREMRLRGALASTQPGNLNTPAGAVQARAGRYKRARQLRMRWPVVARAPSRQARRLAPQEKSRPLDSTHSKCMCTGTCACAGGVMAISVRSLNSASYLITTLKTHPMWCQRDHGSLQLRYGTPAC